MYIHIYVQIILPQTPKSCKMEENFFENEINEDEIPIKKIYMDNSKHKDSTYEENKWQRFANDLGASDKDNFFSSYQDLVNEVIEQIHDDEDSFLISDCDYDSQNSIYSEDNITFARESKKIFQNKRKDVKIQNSIKSNGTKYSSIIEKITKKESSISLFCESMATTILNANLPTEVILQIQRDVLNVVTAHIAANKEN